MSRLITQQKEHQMKTGTKGLQSEQDTIRLELLDSDCNGG